MEREKVIEVKDLVKRFGTFTANDRLTFDVYPVKYSAFWVPTARARPLP